MCESNVYRLRSRAYSGSHTSQGQRGSAFFDQKTLELSSENLVTFKDTGFILSLAFKASTVSTCMGVNSIRAAMAFEKLFVELLL